MNEKVRTAFVVVAALALTAIAIEMVRKRPTTVEVSVFEILEHVNKAEERTGVVQTFSEMTQRDLIKLDRRLNEMADNHNSLVRQVAQDINNNRAYMRLTECALQRLNGKPEWAAAMAGAQVELEEERLSANRPALPAKEEAEQKEKTDEVDER